MVTQDAYGPAKSHFPCCCDSWVVPINAGTTMYDLERAGAAE